MTDKQKFVWNEGELKVSHPEELQCANCKFKGERTSKCEQYPILKPRFVLEKEKDCPVYEKR
ncbi:hypothetical protein ABEX47_03340 [Paenibacillus ehimensis]|uniref:hypothetical protein n=1 Tax=Paenibacillus ehimensis TaxID=79264 RepID=UPI003D2AC006